MRSPARTGDGRAWTVALAAVTVLAALLRWINLGGGLWVDEMYSLVESFRIPFATLLTTFTGDTQHPLYSALANRAVAWLGESNRVIRLPAFFAGVATVPAVYVLGRRWVSRGEALAAALLLAASYHHVWFSQNARGYTMIALATVLSTHLLLRILDQGRPRDVLAYAVVVGLGAYTHLTMVFAAFGHALVLAGLQLVPDSAGRRFRTWRLPALALVGSAVVTVLLYAPMLDEVLNFFLNRPSRLRGISTPAWAVAELGRVLSTGVGAGPGLLAGAALFFVGVVSYAKKAPLACALFVVPGFVTILGALAARGTMYPRFFFFLVGFAFLILARGVFATSAWVAARLVSDPERARVRAGQGAAVAVALIALVFVRSLGYNYAYPKQDWVGTAAWVDANVPAGEPIVTAGVSVWPFEHYLPRPWQAIPDGEDARVSALRAQGPVWVVYVFPRYLESTHPDLARQVEAECEARQQFDGTLGSGDIYACRLPPRPQT